MGNAFLARFVVFQVVHLKVGYEGMVANNRLFGKSNIHVSTFFEEFGRLRRVGDDEQRHENLGSHLV